MAIRLDFGTCQYGNSLRGMHLMQLDHTKLDSKSEQAILEKFKVSTFFINPILPGLWHAPLSEKALPLLKLIWGLS